jgi:hypothetical protein
LDRAFPAVIDEPADTTLDAIIKGAAITHTDTRSFSKQASTSSRIFKRADKKRTSRLYGISFG